MTHEIIGRGWAFPPRVGPNGAMQLTNERTELNEAIRIILSTSPGQRVMRPAFGCRLQELIFAPNDSQTAAQARRYVEDALGMWEPRINVLDIRAYPEPHERFQLMIEVHYEVKATRDQRTLVYPFFLIPEEQ